MALAAVQGGAVGIRANTAKDIRAIQSEIDVPIIGIYKKITMIRTYLSPPL